MGDFDNPRLGLFQGNDWVSRSKYNPDTGELVETWIRPDMTFSIIVPTRRPTGLRMLLNSFVKTTLHPENLEIILVMDNNDKEMLAFYDELPKQACSVKKVVVEPRITMGALNMTGYKASTGRYVMLLNDDVVVQTKGWDEKILKAFQTFPDDIALVHVNDLTFGEKLCVFPFVSRRYCELAGGICRTDYIRYRIDDHIHHTFELMSLLGHNRIVYLPEVVFEHTNFVFDGSGNRQYYLNGNILPHDAELFDRLLPERKDLAVRLIDRMMHEDTHVEDLPLVAPRLLDQLTTSDSGPTSPAGAVSADCMSWLLEIPSVTIGVVSANCMSWHAQTCIRLLKQFTKNFDLILLDNNGRKPFNHAHEMNKIVGDCETDYLVLMDDDVFVEEGWLAGLLRGVSPSVAVVTPLHKNSRGELSYAGVVMDDDYSGNHRHVLSAPEVPTAIQTLCSAIMLINVRKCWDIFFRESYRKYFLDIDYGFQAWDKGYSVVCSPYTTVTHLGGATLRQGSQEANAIHEADRQQFLRNWIDTGDYERLKAIWIRSNFHKQYVTAI